MVKLNKVSFSATSILLLYIMVIPNGSDYFVYESYYRDVNLINFHKYSLDLGYTFLTAIMSSLGVPFVVFWKITNFLCILVFFKFLTNGKDKYLSVALFSVLVFVIVYPFSGNLFSNIIRNTISIALCLYLCRTKSRWYWYALPLCFHISSTLFIFALALEKLTRYFRYKRALQTLVLFLPLMAFIVNQFVIDMISSFESLRTVRYNILSEYKPAFRYMSYILYLKSVILLFYFLFQTDKSNKISRTLHLFYVVSLRELTILYYYFTISLFLYWSLLGVGSTSRLLTYPMWIGNSLWFSLFFAMFSTLIPKVRKTL